MKGRFCILRYGFKFHSIDHCDKTWLTCCALHNMLLEIDGLHRKWENGERSNWENCYHSQLSISNESNFTPFAISRLHSHPLNDSKTFFFTCSDYNEIFFGLLYVKPSADFIAT